MRHRGSALLVTALLLAACGGSTDGGPRTGSPTTGTTPSTSSGTAAPTGSELPPPDPSTFHGKARVVNLFIDGTGGTQDVDVWARRSFTDGPVLLTEGIGYGEASPYFATPESQSVVIVPAGSGADGEEIGGLFAPEDGDQQTTLFVWDGQGQQAASWLLEEASADPAAMVPAPPAAGSGLVVVRADQLTPFGGDDFASTTFYVGTPDTPACLAQVPPGAEGQAATVGGTQATYHEVPAGALALTVHPWPAQAGVEPCSSAPAFGPFDLDVTAGGAAWVFLHTRDGLASVEALVVPWDPIA